MISPQTPAHGQDLRAPAKQRPPKQLPIVGVGASAGGLEAFTLLLNSLPPDTGMTFVFIQHLAPSHESILAELLAKQTKMPVYEASNDVTLEPNSVYVIAPSTDITLENGRLKLQERSSLGSLHMPIDTFFRSLAKEKGRQSIGVILSGTGSDGSLGIEEIHNQGGIAIAQDPGSAKYDSMPRNAIATGFVNFVLPGEKIANELARIGSHSYMRSEVHDSEIGTSTSSDGQTFKKIINTLKVRTGVDFGSYKTSTIGRRIERRMLSNHLQTMESYLAFLNGSPTEAESLYNDILIKVTKFFRDPETFDVLKNNVFEEILKNRKTDAPIRFWVPGCCTGEEVYSLAMALLEFLGERASNVPVQIFGTDISDQALEKARTGNYMENISLDVSPERLRRFFDKANGRYQINKSVRNICVFAKQNILKDPPFSRLDLISCRNVLIYLSVELQKKIMPLFHFALNPNGFLVLGSSESVGSALDIFTATDNKHKIFIKKHTETKLALDFPGSPSVHERRQVLRHAPTVNIGPLRTSVQKEADRLLLSRYAPVGVIINGKLDVIHFFGDTSPFLQNSPGNANFNLLRMAREGLQADLEQAIKDAKAKNAPFTHRTTRAGRKDETIGVEIEVIPFDVPLIEDHFWAVMFRSATSAPMEESKNTPPVTAEVPRKKSISEAENESRWRKELASTKAYLESIIEEKDAAFEELQSANEEILSNNEELQSINEEVQTSKEELQSTNEELTTVNDELNHANLASSQLVSDLNNLLDSISIPIVIVGHDMRLRRFTSRAETILHLIPADIGRPLTDVNMHLNVPNLKLMLIDVMDSGLSKDHLVKSEDGRWYSVRIRPYKTLNKKIDGAIITLIDVDAMKQSEEEIIEARNMAQDTLATIREPLVVIGADLRIRRANKSFYQNFGLEPSDVENRFFFEIDDGQWNVSKLREAIEGLFAQSGPFKDFEVTQEFKRIGKKIMLLNGSKIKSTSKGEDLVLLAIEDVTERKQAETRLVNSNRELQDFTHVVSHDLQAPLRKMISFGSLLKEELEPILTEKARSQLDRIQNNAQKMSDFVTDLLDYSKATNSTNLKQNLVDMNAMAREVIGELDAQISESGGTVQADNLPTVYAYPFQMNQLLTNLIGNALKYRGEVPPVVRISAKREGYIWVFAVQDNGVGIDPSNSKRIFDLFQRTHGSSIPGTGIGLAVCKKIVETHGGRIWVDSAVGKGTTMYFTFPATTIDRA